ncbi:MAG TPA: hypothetical protein VG188_12045, partial [Solirubrobacteraceae bacterium]|nr:hypothetical protein [Solirubrobacteraceae bacterium]
MTTTAPAAAGALSARVSDSLARHLRVHLDRLVWGAHELAEHQRTRLRIVLAQAIEQSPFHAKRLGGLDPDGVEPSDLAGLPVMTKAEMMADFDEVVTDRRLRRAAVEEHLDRFAHEPA